MVKTCCDLLEHVVGQDNEHQQSSKSNTTIHQIDHVKTTEKEEEESAPELKKACQNDDSLCKVHPSKPRKCHEATIKEKLKKFG